MSGQYVNPATEGNGGDVSKKSPGGAKKGQYDDAANKSASPQGGSMSKPYGHKAPSSGYDNIGKDSDFGFKGSGHKSSGRGVGGK